MYKEREREKKRCLPFHQSSEEMKYTTQKMKTSVQIGFDQSENY
jgi:hypothetical protein